MNLLPQQARYKAGNFSVRIQTDKAGTRITIDNTKTDECIYNEVLKDCSFEQAEIIAQQEIKKRK